MDFEQEKAQLAAVAEEFPSWIRTVADMAEARGGYEPLGRYHSALFTKRGPVLVVTFENARKLRQDRESPAPLGWQLTDGKDWSQLCILAHGQSWFRDPKVYGYFDKLVDDGFFEDFDQVVFYGAGAGGYGAAAFSVAAPGATVIAVQPQATLDPRVAEWDQRYTHMRRTSFTDRYGYAPDMLDAAARAFVLYDPEVNMDAMHAALFTRPNVARLRLRHMGKALEADLLGIGALGELIEAACEGRIEPEVFHRAYRARRRHMPYLRNLLARLENDQRPLLVKHLCNSVVARMNAPRFRKARDQAEALLAHAHETAGS